MIGIYKITNPKGKIYIGQSININKRFKDYSRIYGSVNQTKLNNSFKKYGYENHVMDILCECNIEDLNEKERFYQDLYSAIGNNGLNLKLTTSNTKTGLISEETRLKMSISQTGRVQSTEQRIKNSINKKGNTNMLGKRHSEDTKKRLSEISKINTLGRIKTEETKIKIGLAKLGNTYALGKKRSAESKLKISIIQKNNLKIRKIILDTETGVFYYGVLEAAIAVNQKRSALSHKLLGRLRNNTSLIFV